MDETASRQAWVLNDRISRQEISARDDIFDFELFGSKSLPMSPYVFVHTDILNQDSLVECIVRKHVSLILDLRFRPIFDRPQFDHREIIEYFREKNVVYLDCVYYASNENDSERLLERYRQAFKKLDQKNFWSIFLFDDQTVDSQLLAEFRNGFRGGAKPFREVHPELFFGRTKWKSLSLDPPPKPA